MYTKLTRQAFPSQEYCELLGTAICVFNSNNAFVIENILHTNSLDYNWYELIDKESGQLKSVIKNSITKVAGEKIETLFSEIVDKRNRIVHSYQVTHNGQQILATKTKAKEGNKQFIITKEFLMDFIKKNESLCLMLHDYRDKLRLAV